VITLNTWARIAVGFFTQISASDVRPVLALSVNGVIVLMSVAAAWADSAGDLYCGYNPSNGTHGCPGYHDSVVVSQWAGAPYFDGARELMERDYFEGSPVPHQTAYYTENNNLSDAMGGAASVRVGGADFAASGIAKPCD
jgi:hypothetical protein